MGKGIIPGAGKGRGTVDRDTINIDLREKVSSRGIELNINDR